MAAARAAGRAASRSAATASPTPPQAPARGRARGASRACVWGLPSLSQNGCRGPPTSQTTLSRSAECGMGSADSAPLLASLFPVASLSLSAPVPSSPPSLLALSSAVSPLLSPARLGLALRSVKAGDCKANGEAMVSTALRCDALRGAAPLSSSISSLLSGRSRLHSWSAD